MKPLNHHSFPNRKLFQKPLSTNCNPNMTQNENGFAICCRPEVARDVISGENVNTDEDYALLSFGTASISGSRENRNRPLA